MLFHQPQSFAGGSFSQFSILEKGSRDGVLAEGGLLGQGFPGPPEGVVWDWDCGLPQGTFPGRHLAALPESCMMGGPSPGGSCAFRCSHLID